MKKIALLLLLSVASLRADELTKNVQTELKELGFFYAEVNGNSGPETTAAIRRFQIRNGYEVTGTLTKETLKGLGLGEKDAPAKVAPAPAPVKKDAPFHLRRDEAVEESDRDFLRREAAKQRSGGDRDPSTVRPPAPLNPPPDPGRADFSHIFANTPYESAPVAVQVSTVRSAQSFMARGGFYRAAIDGEPGPATEEALLRFQRRQNLVMSGRLDLETLSAMSLLPRRNEDMAARPFTVPRGSRSAPRVYRGIWVN